MSKAMAPEGWRCAGAAFALSLVFAPLGHAASNDSFTIDSVSPPEAVPGAQVILQGSGFGTSAEELFAWVAGPDSGFPLEVLTADDGQLRARVGATAEPLSGTLTLWKGQPLRLADGVLAAGGRLFTMTDTRLLVVTRTAAGPSFSSLAGSPAAVGSTGLGRSMVVNVATLGDILVGTGPARGRVDVVVATNGEPCNPPGGGGQGIQAAGATADGGTAWVASWDLAASSWPADPEELAEALAAVFRNRLEDLEVQVEADGSHVELRLVDCDRQAGFIVLSFGGATASFTSR